MINDDAGNPIEEYTYGASRNRLINETASGRTYYVWGGNSPIGEYTEASSSSTPAWNKSYIYAGSRLLSTATKDGTGERIVFHHPGRLGTSLVTDPSAGTSSRQSTLPFGTAIGAESTGYTNQVFTSYDRSASTGLDYAVNRTHSSTQGRFTQVDPIGMAATSLVNPQSNNLYAYVQNMPSDFVDSLGLNLEEPKPGDVCAPNPNRLDGNGIPVYDGTVDSNGACRRNSQAGTSVYWEGGWVPWSTGPIWVPAGGYPGDQNLGYGGGGPTGPSIGPRTDSPVVREGNPGCTQVGASLSATAFAGSGNGFGGTIGVAAGQDFTGPSSQTFATMSGGALAGGTSQPGGVGYPSNQGYVFGAFVDVGPSVVFSTARSPGELAGTSSTHVIGTPFFSAQIGLNRDGSLQTIEIGPGGIGAGYMNLQTQTGVVAAANTPFNLNNRVLCR